MTVNDRRSEPELIVPAVTTAGCEPHTPHPPGYAPEASRWYEKMTLTYVQRQCAGCLKWLIWEPRDKKEEAVTETETDNVTELPPNILLSGTVGSVAYGLDTPGSDVDVHGVFAWPAEALLSLGDPLPLAVRSAPGNWVYHEARQFARLALRSNPTATELLWLPADLYHECGPHGAKLISIRKSFLSREGVRREYLGYAKDQQRRLEKTGPAGQDRARVAKHGRHLARVLKQGLELYTHGTLTVRLDDPEYYRDFGERVADGELEVGRGQIATVERLMIQTGSPLPEHPDPGPAENWLQGVRRACYPIADAMTAVRAARKAAASPRKGT